MSEEPTIPIPAEEPRHCPACGTRVAERATTCLMCGASLVEEEEIEGAPRQLSRWFFWGTAIVVSLLVLAIAGLLLQPFIFPATTPVSTATPTLTATPTRTERPTSIPTVTATPTPIPPRAHQVQTGETLASIASSYDITVDEILTLNPGIAPELLQVGQVLLIPPAVPTPEATAAEDASPTATLSGDFIVHVVAPGETLLSIAQQYSVTIALIRAANADIPPGSDVIQVNQPLIIPLGTPMPTYTPTFDPHATPTALPPYSPPPLLSPPNAAVFGGPDEIIVLQWASVDILRANEWYELHVARPGEEPVAVRTRATAYRAPADLYPQPEAFSREFSWWVRVVRRGPGADEYEQASESGETRSFLWLEELPTPTATPSPSPTP
jgi:LysM repeat protein